MKLVFPKKMTELEVGAYRLCMSRSRLPFLKADLADALARQISVIDEGVRVIERDFPIPSAGDADFVAMDGKGRLLLAGIFDNLDPAAVARYLQMADWAGENSRLMERIHGIDPRAGTKLWLFAEQTSPGAMSVLNHLSGCAVEVFSCACLDLGDERWLVLEKFFEACDNKTSTPAKSLRLNSVLSEDEVGEFFGEKSKDPNDDEDITSSFAL